MTVKTIAIVILAVGTLAGCEAASGTTTAGSRADAVGAPGAVKAATTAASGSLPCDIYASGGTPCVAAHSTARALYSSYNGPLYQVKRTSDGATQDISTLSAGGYADSAAQDSFCSGTYCTITKIYDQSGHGNDLTPGPAGTQGPADLSANAAALPATMAGGNKVYGVFISPHMGYRNDSTTGVATGDDPEGEYSVFGGTHYNNGCCFDYGNAETTNTDPGNGHMEAIYFGTAPSSPPAGAGSGPWIAADLENGLFTQDSLTTNPSDPSMNDQFVTGIVKGKPGTWAIRGGNAQSGGLSTFYSGARPTPNYNPMSKEGAIILGIGGDNSQQSAGSWFEGAMTSGYPSDATENAVQASITAAGYTDSGTFGFTPGSRISLQATTACCTADSIAHDDGDDQVKLADVTASSTDTQKADATWIVHPGLANSACVSFESANESGTYLRHSNFHLLADAPDGTATYNDDATFCPRPGNNGQGYSLMSNNYSDHYIRHYNGTLYAASDGGPNAWDATALWADDSSWSTIAPWAP